ncbi:hypothetical protein EAH68_00155 [Corynebacterium hylobatis]|uniref:Uncharacterized protein n=1 Tax=Corynebacterium hylobatis TaxID=1859290 RepID=A0A430I299_9CORY|nr:hypothetical protein [Corynebacterium hylobatis]RSZ66013.1 hypothetical protein EAH68_00155 [Corynebacterium hylobatis]
MSTQTLASPPRWRILLTGAVASVMVLTGCSTTGNDAESPEQSQAEAVLPATITDNLSLCEVLVGGGALTAELQTDVEETFCIWDDENFPRVEEDINTTTQTLNFATDAEVVRHIEAIEAGDPEDPVSQTFGWEEIWNDGSNGKPRVVVYHWPAGTVANVKLAYPEDDFAAHWTVQTTVTPEEAKEFLAGLGVM